jgi:protein gp37
VNKTPIEWCNWTSNPVKGYCPVACPYCYSRKQYNRFKWDKTLRFDPDELSNWGKAKAGDKMFVGSMIELFYPYSFAHYLDLIRFNVTFHPEVTFIFLTKLPHYLPRWSPWPANCWVGATATDTYSLGKAIRGLGKVESTVRFISFEPLLDRIPVAHSGWDIVGDFANHILDWVIIGAMTGSKADIIAQSKQHPDLTPLWVPEVHRWTLQPKPEWVQEIIDAADSADMSVFLKDNLRWPTVRREWPI